jgi:hypothetical protein
MGKRLRAHPRRPTNQQELGQRLQEIWEDIGQDEIRTLINSMGRRCLQLFEQEKEILNIECSNHMLSFVIRS